jgi:hypothetical protein
VGSEPPTPPLEGDGKEVLDGSEGFNPDASSAPGVVSVVPLICSCDKARLTEPDLEAIRRAAIRGITCREDVDKASLNMVDRTFVKIVLIAWEL